MQMFRMCIYMVGTIYAFIVQNVLIVYLQKLKTPLEMCFAKYPGYRLVVCQI